MFDRKRLGLFLAVSVALATPALAQIKRLPTEENQIVLQGPGWQLTFDGERGGELSKVLLWDGRKWYRVNSSFAFKSLDTLPALSFASTKDSYYSGKWDVFYSNEGRKCKFEMLKETPTEVHFKVTNYPTVMENGQVGPLAVTYTWHVYEPGVVFCDFDVELPKDKTFELAWSMMGMHVEDYVFKEKHAGMTDKFVWNWGRLDETTDRGRWQPVLCSSPGALPLDVDLPRDQSASVYTGKWTPYGSATFNLDHQPATSYTNSMEVVFENAKPLVGEDLANFGSHFKFRQSGLSPPPTSWGSDRNPPTFSFEWNLWNGESMDLVGPVSYHNRFGMAFTGMRVTGSPQAPLPLRNRLQGAGIYHWVNAGKSGSAWYPTDQEIAAMAAQGADVLVLGDGWRKGPADYAPADEAQFKRTVAAAHQNRLRVGVSMRADDYPLLEKDTSWFSNYLEKDRDGLYVERAGFLSSPSNPNAYPVQIKDEGVTALGSSENHIDAYAHFLWTKKLRALVGDNGFLIGRTAPEVPTRIALAYFDCYAPDDTDLYTNPDMATYRRFHTGNGCAQLAGIGRTSRGARPLAFAAAYGDSPQVMLGAGENDPPDPADRANNSFAPLWKIWRSADVASATAYNTLSTATKVFKFDSAGTQGTLYRISKDELMLVVANLGPTADTAVELNFKELNIPEGDFAGKVVRIDATGETSEDAQPAVVKGGKFKTGELGRFGIAAFHLKRQ